MSKLRVIVLLLTGTIVLLHAVAGAAVVTDQAGRTVALPDNPARIVSFAPSVTEIVCALGAGKRLVGVTAFSNYPAEMQQLPKVGSYVRLDLERIVALKPDVCIAIRDGNPKRAIDRLEELGVPVIVIDPDSLEHLLSAIEQLGSLLHCSCEAQKLVDSLRGRLLRVDALVRTVTYFPKVLFQLQRSPVVGVGSGTFIHELITRAGGRNVLAQMPSYPRLSREDVLVLSPEVIIAPGMTGTDRSAILEPWTSLTSIPAVSSGAIFTVRPDWFNRPSPRSFLALERLVALLHPTLITDRELLPNENVP